MADVAENEGVGLEARVLALGRQGMGRLEIAEALDLTGAQLKAMEVERATLKAAMTRAEAAARSWWEAAPREALAAGVRFNMGAWLGAMNWRFGAVKVAEDRAAAGRGGSGTVVILPCNGRTRRLPDGTCPHAGGERCDWMDEEDDDDWDEPDEDDDVRSHGDADE